jgi:hypothetical protein
MTLIKVKKTQTKRRRNADKTQRKRKKNEDVLQLKKEKKERKEEGKKDIYGEFANVRLTQEEYDKLGSDVKQMIERLSAYKASTGKTYRDDYATILNWRRRDGVKTGKPANFKQREYTEDQFVEMYEPVETEGT